MEETISINVRRLLEFAKDQQMKIVSTLFKTRSNQIDHVLMEIKYKSLITNVRSYNISK